MQVYCNKFFCHKAVEVCYWACKYRRDCKDWHGALDVKPGTAAIQAQLETAARKSGRAFDTGTLVFLTAKKPKRKAPVAKAR